MILTTEEVKSHLRILTDDEDALLLSLMAQAESVASDYCRVDWTSMEIVPEPVRLAVLLFISHFYENRDSSDRSAYNTMMKSFQTLLYPYRAVDKLF